MFNGQVVSAADIQKYVGNRSETTVIDTLKSSAFDPHVTPLYYVLVRFWAQLFGDAIASLRSFSAFLSLLCLPALYWLAMELFASSTSASLAVALMAVSPFHVIYAQEARNYSLWTLTILLSSVLLLRAIKHANWKNWCFYALAMAASLYAHLFSVLLFAAHGIYVGWYKGWKPLDTVKKFAIASGISLLLFSPWILIIILKITTVQSATNWMKQPLGIIQQIQTWLGSVLTVVFDNGSYVGQTGSLLNVNSRIFVIIILWSFWVFWKKSPQSSRKLIGAITIVFMALNILPFLSAGYALSGIIRYQIPFLISINLVLAYAFAYAFPKNPTIWKLVLSFILISGFASCLKYSQAASWWNKGNAYHHWQAAQYINQQNNSLLVSRIDNNNRGKLIAISYYLKPQEKLLLFSKKNSSHYQIPDNFKNILVFNPSDYFLENLKKSYQLDRVKPESLNLWKVRANAQ
ncbi:glycosyltransferase family 39 protein [Baaleninema sp.]|uniref:glycosyltransferase family 39 protein n=1 Tax=Baaleninema sp. TaxID=3101197 RepID=UPI003D05E9F7